MSPDSEIVRKPALLHEWDAPPGMGTQRIGGRWRLVVWNACARCGQFITMHLDVTPSLVLPASPEQQVGEIVRQMGHKLAGLACPGAPLPLPGTNGAA